jgi:hypothetical protein
MRGKKELIFSVGSFFLAQGRKKGWNNHSTVDMCGDIFHPKKSLELSDSFALLHVKVGEWDQLACGSRWGVGTGSSKKQISYRITLQTLDIWTITDDAADTNVLVVSFFLSFFLSVFAVVRNNPGGPSIQWLEHALDIIAPWVSTTIRQSIRCETPTLLPACLPACLPAGGCSYLSWTQMPGIYGV